MAARQPQRASAALPGLGLLLGIALGILGLVFIYQSMNPTEGGEPPMVMGISLATPVPGILVLVAGLLIALWAIRGMQGMGGSRIMSSHTEVAVTWTLQPPPGAKTFGNPPQMPGQRALLAQEGLEAFRGQGGDWRVRRLPGR
jgi:crotonobetainyl-CoA:carnitine CoA-transferase CaiB-like acyl-CoA transferase